MPWQRDSHGVLGFQKKERTRQSFREQVASELALKENCLDLWDGKDSREKHQE